MKKILDFFNTNKYCIIWTLCYFFIVWAIMLWMFNFDIFSSTQWHILAHAKLRGFPGFVFGIMILAALPLYVATTILIYRNKKPLITIPLSNLFGPVPIEKEQQEQATNNEQTSNEHKLDETPITRSTSVLGIIIAIAVTSLAGIVIIKKNNK